MKYIPGGFLLSTLSDRCLETGLERKVEVHEKGQFISWLSS